MAVVDDKDPAPEKKKLGFQGMLAVFTGSLTAVTALGTSAWFLLSPRLDKYIDDHLAEKHPPTSLAAAPGATTALSDFDIPGLKLKIDGLTNKFAELSALQKQYGDLLKAVTDLKAKANFNSTYGYSFRFKGAEILAQQRPPSRLYFYATSDDEVKVSVYLASQKFPVTLKVDGIAVRPIIRDSREWIRVTDQLIQTSLEEVTPIKEAILTKEGAPPTIEDPRPQYVHYIEFVPGDVTYQFGKNDDYDVSGIVLVTKKTI